MGRRFNDTSLCGVIGCYLGSANLICVSGILRIATLLPIALAAVLLCIGCTGAASFCGLFGAADSNRVRPVTCKKMVPFRRLLDC